VAELSVLQNQQATHLLLPMREHFVNYAAGGLDRGTEAAPAVEVEAACFYHPMWPFGVFLFGSVLWFILGHF